MELFEQLFFIAYHHWSFITTKEEWFVQLIVKVIDRPSDISSLKYFNNNEGETAQCPIPNLFFKQM